MTAPLYDEFKFWLNELTFWIGLGGAAVALWKVSAWVTRKQVVVEDFFGDMREFMQQTNGSLERIELNHLTHMQQSLQRLERERPSEEVDDAVRE